LTWAKRLPDEINGEKAFQLLWLHTKRDTLEIVAPWTEVKMLKHGDTLMRFLEI
jgi:hypothetical protein